MCMCECLYTPVSPTCYRHQSFTRGLSHSYHFPMLFVERQQCFHSTSGFPASPQLGPCFKHLEQLLDLPERPIFFSYSTPPLKERAPLLRAPPPSLAPECLVYKALVLSVFWGKLLYNYCAFKAGQKSPVPII